MQATLTDIKTQSNAQLSSAVTEFSDQIVLRDLVQRAVIGEQEHNISISVVMQVHIIAASKVQLLQHETLDHA